MFPKIFIEKTTLMPMNLVDNLVNNFSQMSSGEIQEYVLALANNDFREAMSS